MNDQVRGDRRHFLFAGAGLTGAALAAPAPIFAAPGSSVPSSRIDLSDPRAALEAYVKLRGSTADETVFQPYEGDIFLAADGKIGIPLCGFKGIQKSVWKPDGRGGFTNADFDVGFYIDYQTRQILDTWVNPVTGKTVKVYHYRGGPSGGHFTVGASGGDVYSSPLGRWSIVGDHIWHTSSNWGERPNMMKPADWPQASSGETVLGSMTLAFAGRVSDVAAPHIRQAPSYQIWSNTSNWMPWMDMGQRPGFNHWRWIGAKGEDPAAIDPALVAAVESVCPGYVSRNRLWRQPTSGRLDYMRAAKGLPLTQ